VNGNGIIFFQDRAEGLSRAFSKKEVNTHSGTWRHPPWDWPDFANLWSGEF